MPVMVLTTHMTLCVCIRNLIVVTHMGTQYVASMVQGDSKLQQGGAQGCSCGPTGVDISLTDILGIPAHAILRVMHCILHAHCQSCFPDLS